MAKIFGPCVLNTAFKNKMGMQPGGQVGEFESGYS